MKVDKDTDQRTIETRLACPELYPIIELMLGFYARIRHLLWRDLIIKKSPINELKSGYIAKYQLTGRQFSSLAADASGKAKATEELQALQRRDLETRILVQNKSVALLYKKMRYTSATLKAIEGYRAKIASWKERCSLSKRSLKKPVMPQPIRGKFKERLLADQKAVAFALHQKKRRLDILGDRLNCLKARAHPSICFGSKKLFKAQFHLAQNEYTSHDEWRSDFHCARTTHVTFVGSSDESAGNQTVQYDPASKTLKLRLPNAPLFSIQGKYLKIPGVVFPSHLYPDFLAALALPSSGRRGQKTSRPVTYRFVRRINEKTGERAYYVQASFVVEAPEIVTSDNLGVVGVDINADHLAVAESDRFGNLVDSFLVPFDLSGVSSNQAEAIIGDVIAVVVNHATKKLKPLVIEELDFAQKKSALRLLPRFRRKFLSQFSYAQFIAGFQSKARAQGVRLDSINPAYTSLIGAYKYQGLKISTHEKAALAIARRAQGFTEGLKVFYGTLPSQVMMAEKASFERSPRHVWGFYSDHQQLIRRLFIDSDRRPFLPLRRAISLTKLNPSLHRSLAVIREKRTFEELRCSSG